MVKYLFLGYSLTYALQLRGLNDLTMIFIRNLYYLYVCLHSLHLKLKKVLYIIPRV